MSSAKVNGFLAASFLVLALLTDATAACYCLGQPQPDLQDIFCASDVVVKGMFVDATLGDPKWYYARYHFKTTQVFKAPEMMQEVHSLYTKLVGSTCGYRHNGPFNNDEYVVAGHLIQNRLIISVCSFIKPWDDISREQRRGLMLVYPTRCN